MKPSQERITVVKLNLQHAETWRYGGRVLKWADNSILIEARFNREDLPFHGITLGENDRFVERYYTDRWYNIFAIHDRDDDHLKGWYCNVTLPAEITSGRIAYVDLALDLLVFPGGRRLTLDEDEFANLPIDGPTRQKALDSLAELEGLAESGELANETA